MKRLLFILGGAGIAAWTVSRLRRSEYSFTGKSIVITGGSRGLGLTIARRLAMEGARIALLARDEEELAEACRELQAIGGEALAVPCDLLDRARSLGAIETVMDRFGAIDVLINNAGMIEVGPLDHMRRQDFEQTMDLHFWAPFHLMQQTIPHMRRAGGGRIVNVASVGGKIAVPHMAPYNASKFALVGLSDSFRAELAREGIKVTTVTPGVMRTGSHVHAKFKGNHGAEYTWFALSASLPVAATAPERAAEMIVEACRLGQSSLIIGLSARMLIAGNALFPSLTGEMMKLVNRILPGSTGAKGDELKSGFEAREEQRLPGFIVPLDESAVAKHNEA